MLAAGAGRGVSRWQGRVGTELAAPADRRPPGGLSTPHHSQASSSAARSALVVTPEDLRDGALLEHSPDGVGEGLRHRNALDLGDSFFGGRGTVSVTMMREIWSS